MSTGSWDQPSLFGGGASFVNQSTSGSTVLRREARRETVGSGPNAVVKLITTETVVGPDGRTKTVTTETVESRGAAGSRGGEITFRIDQVCWEIVGYKLYLNSLNILMCMFSLLKMTATNWVF